MSSETEHINPTDNAEFDENVDETRDEPKASAAEGPEEVQDDTPDIPNEPDCNLPVQNPITDLEFAGFPESLLEDFPRAPWEELTFEQWNEKIEEAKAKFRIYYPAAFTMNAPPMKFEAPKSDTAPKKDGSGEMAKFLFSKIHEPLGRGREMSYVITSPAMIAPSGYKESDTGNGLVKSIKGTLDFNNPQHRHFWFGTMTEVISMCTMHILQYPTEYGFTFEALPPDADMTSKKNIRIFEDVFNKFFPLLRLPKIGEKEFDRESTRRIFYINPLMYYDPKKKVQNNMKVFLPGSSESTSLDCLENICKGWLPKNGRVVKGKPKGFEFTVDLLVSRIVRTSGNSIQIKGLNLYIHRFFKAESKGARESRQLTALQGRLANDFNRFAGLEGFKDETVKAAPSKLKKINPMAGSNGEGQDTKAEEKPPSDLPDENFARAGGKSAVANVEQPDSKTPAKTATSSTRKFTSFKRSADKKDETV